MEHQDQSIPSQSGLLQDSCHAPRIPRQSSRLQTGNSSGSDSPPEPNGPRDNLPQSQSTYTLGNGPAQIFTISGASPADSPTTPLSSSNNGSFNQVQKSITKTVNKNTTLNVNVSQINNFRPVEPTIPEQDDVGSDTDPPRTPTTQVGAVPGRLRSLQIPTPDIPRTHVQTSNPSPSTSTNNWEHILGLASTSSSRAENDDSKTSIFHARASEQAALHVLSPTADPLELRGEPLHIMDSIEEQELETFPDQNGAVQVAQKPNLASKFKKRVKSARTSITSGISRSIASFATQSIFVYNTATADTLQPVKKVPAVQRLPGLKKEFLEAVELYMHAPLDPSRNADAVPAFHPLWDPNISHKRRESSDGSLPEVHGINVYDVGYFDVRGDFILLFNLRLSKQRNEELLKIKFDDIPFLPLAAPHVTGRELESMRSQYRAASSLKIQEDRTLSKYNKSNQYQYAFKVGGGDVDTTGAAIAMMGPLMHFRDDEEAIFDFKDYFDMQCIQWYRYAKRLGKHHIENGDLVLITECYKVPSWGFIVDPDKKRKETIVAYFRCGDGGNGLYGWTYPVVPGRKRLEDRCHQAEVEKPTKGTPDQCIGFRGYTVHCNPKDWKIMCKKELKKQQSCIPR